MSARVTGLLGGRVALRTPFLHTPGTKCAPDQSALGVRLFRTVEHCPVGCLGWLSFSVIQIWQKDGVGDTGRRLQHFPQSKRDHRNPATPKWVQPKHSKQIMGLVSNDERELMLLDRTSSPSFPLFHLLSPLHLPDMFFLINFFLRWERLFFLIFKFLFFLERAVIPTF